MVVVLVAAGAVSAARGPATAAARCDPVQLRFGPDVQAADQRAVDEARAALAGLRPEPSAAPRRSTPLATAAPRVTTPVRMSSSRLRAAAAAVAEDERQVAAAEEELERVTKEQQRAADPALYDEQVAAAEEALSLAREQLADDRRTLAALRRAARTPAPAPAPVVTRAVPTPRPTPSRTDAGRAALEQRLADAQAQQAEHLAARRTELAQARERGCPAG